MRCAVEMKPLPGVTFVQGDFLEQFSRNEIELALQGKRVDVMLSDLAPNCELSLLLRGTVCDCFDHLLKRCRIAGHE